MGDYTVSQLICIEKEQVMYTLPVDNNIAESEPIAGKVSAARTWQLYLRVVPGVMTDFDTWQPGADHVRFSNRDLTLQVRLGNQLLMSTSLTQDAVVLESAQIDPAVPARQILSISLMGYPQQEMLDNNRHAGIVLELSINNLSMLNVLENSAYYQIFDTDEIKSGGSLMGQNGCQLLEIYTPIHVWLLQNQQHICDYYTNPRSDAFK
jgi:hypothetical protein